MKTLFVGIFAMLITSVAMASGNLKVNMTDNESETTVMEITNAEVVNYEIELTDAWGNKIYEMNTEIPRGDFEKRYDLSGLENGTYWYFVRTGDEEVSKQLSVEYGDVEVMSMRKTVDPYFHQVGEKVNLTYLNYENEKINLYVYENSTLLKEISLGNEFTIHKRIDLSDLNPGEYSVVLTNEMDIYEESIVIN
ncbi:hypothetical protein [Draconibacterium halophilum]|uniref:Por secretion system C-terminal sorting domain-containing protein n=1 Tax=Draconibacterium halophilum TaxID=2706887 RepID=A0A6C0RA50_9BACT|nr:hypothetical protein [Draconibacterium halophilum]QIA06852.1 hypothetical protein G0Q07_03480 [Draconibacterium halophilum]